MRLKNKLIKTSTKTDKIGSLVLILFLFFGFSLFIKVVPQFFFHWSFRTDITLANAFYHMTLVDAIEGDCRKL